MIGRGRFFPVILLLCARAADVLQFKSRACGAQDGLMNWDPVENGVGQ